jgi:hypothetical protein
VQEARLWAGPIGAYPVLVRWSRLYPIGGATAPGLWRPWERVVAMTVAMTTIGSQGLPASQPSEGISHQPELLDRRPHCHRTHPCQQFPLRRRRGTGSVPRRRVRPASVRSALPRCAERIAPPPRYRLRSAAPSASCFREIGFAEMRRALPASGRSALLNCAGRVPPSRDRLRSTGPHGSLTVVGRDRQRAVSMYC